ncbi:hypothetical protein BDV98DRAFT_470652, partial [Pterulicium gracile]
VEGSTFSYGAGTTGPSTSPQPHESLIARSNSAAAQLTPKQRSKISKADSKQTKRLSKIIKTESRVEKEALAVAIKELEELQGLQRAAVKREAKFHTIHSDTLLNFQKHEEVYLAARRRYEILQAQLRADADALESSRQGARDMTLSMQEKSREIEGLRMMLNVDESERLLKLNELKGK